MSVGEKMFDELHRRKGLYPFEPFVLETSTGRKVEMISRFSYALSEAKMFFFGPRNQWNFLSYEEVKSITPLGTSNAG